MMNDTAKKVMAPAMSLLMVAGAGAAAVVPALGAQQAVAAPAAAAVQAQAGAVAPTTQTFAQVMDVVGCFAYDQLATTPAIDISSVFAKAAAALCASAPEYGLTCACGALQVTAPGASLEATVPDLATEDEASSYTLKCACASNVAGGGAVANADVSGVSLAGVAKAAGAR